MTIPLETNNWAAVWRYPDDEILTVLIERDSDVEKIANGGSIAESITELFAPHVSQVAAGPRQKLTFFPKDAYRVPGAEDAPSHHGPHRRPDSFLIEAEQMDTILRAFLAGA